MKKIAIYLLASTVLLGCGGDDSDSDYESINNINLPSGFYTGTTDESEYLEGLVDDDSKLWFIYSKTEDFLGVIKSDNTVVLDNSQFVASGKNYSFDNRAYRNIIINGNYTTSKAITGTLVESGSATIDYNLGYEETVSAKKHTLSMINNKVYMSNSYVSGVNSSSPIMIKFTTDGNFTSSDSRGCNISGKLTPSASEHYFLSKITFSGTSCSVSGYKVGEVYTGISVVDGKNNDEILFINTDTTGDTSVVFI